MKDQNKECEIYHRLKIKLWIFLEKSIWWVQLGGDKTIHVKVGLQRLINHELSINQ